MDGPARGNSGVSSENSCRTNHALDAYDLNNAEKRSKSLIHEILGTCQELRFLNQQTLRLKQEIQEVEGRVDSSEDMADAGRKLQQHRRDLEQGSNAIIQKISSLSYDLESAKGILIQAAQAMEANAQKLESQCLNNPTAELQLKRASEVALAETERLRQFIEEIGEALNQAMEAMAGSDEQSGKPPYDPAIPPFSERQPKPPDLDNILAGFDTARGIPSGNYGSYGASSSTYDQGPPKLRSASSSGLESSLRKVFTPSPGRLRIHADPYTGGLYVEDGYYGRVEFSYDPYDPVVGPMATGARYGSPIMAQAGFDGSYVAYGPGGVSALFQPGAFGGW